VLYSRRQLSGQGVYQEFDLSQRRSACPTQVLDRLYGKRKASRSLSSPSRSVCRVVNIAATPTVYSLGNGVSSEKRYNEMKSFFVIGIAALGLAALAPKSAEAGVHFGISFGPAYYYPEYYPGYYYGYHHYCGPRYYGEYYRPWRHHHHHCEDDDD